MVAVARRALLLLGCTAILQVTAGTRFLLNCPKGWSYYKSSCFRYFRQLRTWDEAEAQCQSSHSGAHLVWVEEPKEAATLRKVISYYQRSQPVWLGLYHQQQSKSWRWTNGVEYDDSSKLPGNGAQGGDCALLTQTSGFSVWSSADCKRRHHFICKFTPSQ
ncbi:regenerating islet-derived protein 4 isoform X1 [Anser cygnoides]|uniref:regenerating islet-derived protein 4 isoform X1 n=1 Tax=Anser cygnoides TaxID=8845 RepID=UPI0006712B2D|nr:regenerating islet-derived protein 4 isoform X1 [Anser cygnoides]XP_047936197.1 regenerating islet-derived protein 4 isoform X1 [Anser cygnoides]